MQGAIDNRRYGRQLFVNHPTNISGDLCGYWELAIQQVAPKVCFFVWASIAVCWFSRIRHFGIWLGLTVELTSPAALRTTGKLQFRSPNSYVSINLKLA